MGGTLTTTQFYFYGRSHFTATGYQSHAARYAAPQFHSSVSLLDKTYMVTGANNGLGKEITQFLYDKGATVYMVCRSSERALEAKGDIVSKSKLVAEISKGDRLPILICDCGKEADVRSTWQAFASKSSRLDGLICNAGALLNQRTLTPDGLETTFATHLLYGTYLLGKLAMPMLEQTPDSRLIMVSSGGMYNSKFPSWTTATSHASKADKYDGQLAYVYAKRGQVLLAERWAVLHPKVKVVSCHPGWTLTDGVEKAYGTKKSMLDPLRSLWEGAEGICWLATAPSSDIVGGEFYLDREPQFKHVSGYGLGVNTKNTALEVDNMMAKLETWSSAESRLAAEAGECAAAAAAASGR